MSISKEKEKALIILMKRLGINEADLIEKFITGSGKGGQKINKTASCVYLKHIPSKIEVKCQANRSQALNRYLARQELCKQIAEKIHGEKTKKAEQINKIRRQKQRRSRRLKTKILEDKKKHSKIKQERKKPEIDLD